MAGARGRTRPRRRQSALRAARDADPRRCRKRQRGNARLELDGLAGAGCRSRAALRRHSRAIRRAPGRVACERAPATGSISCPRSRRSISICWSNDVVPLLRQQGLRPAGYDGSTLARPSRPAARRQPLRGLGGNHVAQRQMHLGVFTYPGGHHIAGWRHKSVDARCDPRLRLLSPHGGHRRARQVRPAVRGRHAGGAREGRPRHRPGRAEQHRFDLDHVGGRRAPPNIWASWRRCRPPTTSPTPSPSRFASLDHISGGRAGWNIITTANDDAALNFSRKSHMEKTMRYQRAKEFVDICKELWDGWDDGAVVAARGNGVFVDHRQGAADRPPGAVLLGEGRARPAALAAGLAGAGAGRRLARRAGIRRHGGAR